MDLSKAYDPKKVEEKIYSFWQKSGFFNSDKLPKTHKKPFSIVIPPPNVTGSLHMGHALNGTVQDIIIRWQRMRGRKTLWLPGTDHAGIATQNVVEKELKKEGLSRHDLGRRKFLERVWAWKEKYGHIIWDQFKKLGCSCDWSRARFTMDKEYVVAVEKAFATWHQKGWIYRGERVVNWCPRCASTLSDLELEYKKEQGCLWYIRYPLKKQSGSCHSERNSDLSRSEVEESHNGTLRLTPQGDGFVEKNTQYITVATTRPETMLGDTAVAVNPKDERYQDLIGQKIILPLTGREIPIIADRIIDKDFGTGALKVTPAHDMVDFLLSRRHKLPVLKVIDEKSKIIFPAPKKYQRLSAAEAREKVLEDLKQQNLLEKIEPYQHNVAKCYRCGATIEPLTSKQWFVKMDELAKLAIEALKSGQIKFHPQRWGKICLNWLKNIDDWCISRQIWWGHQLPIWHCQKSRNPNDQSPITKQTPNPNDPASPAGPAMPTGRQAAAGAGRQNSKQKENYFLSLEKPKKCPVCGSCQPEQISDVLDTWFSSALWPFATLGWPKETKDLKTYYPTDILSTDRGIINLWVARMIFAGLDLTGEKPFSDVYIHATVLTREGKRMSKSLGTGVDPLELIEKYGADATRFGIAWQATEAQDIKFVEDNILMGKKFCNKIWNASRFILQQISKEKMATPDCPPERRSSDSSRRTEVEGSHDLDQEYEISRLTSFARNDKNKLGLTSADRKIVKKLDETIKSVNQGLKKFHFSATAHKLYIFFWRDFCDVYIEAAKSQKDKKSTEKILLYVLINSLKLLHPFIPFITEKIYQGLPIKDKSECLMIEKWPK